MRFIGCSNLPADQVVAALSTSERLGLHGFVSCQDEYSLAVRKLEETLMPVLEAHGLGLLPYAPLASGLLTGKYVRGEPLPAGARLSYTERLADRFLTERNWTTVERLSAFCARHGHTMLELAFSWLARRPVVASIIAGATTPQQVEQNVGAVCWDLTAPELEEIDRLAPGPLSVGSQPAGRPS